MTTNLDPCAKGSYHVQKSPYRGCKGFHPSNHHQISIYWALPKRAVTSIEKVDKVPRVEGLWQPEYMQIKHKSTNICVVSPFSASICGTHRLIQHQLIPVS